MSFLRMQDVDLAGRRVLIREDLNVPLKDGKITSDARILAALPTLKQARDAGARVLVLSHLGRPKAGEYDAQFSLEPVAARLGELLGSPVLLHRDWLDGVDVAPGEVALAENVRFNVGESRDDEVLARRIAQLCDVFVMDAFAAAHRAHASTHGVALHAPVAVAGPLLAAELDALSRALHKPARPLVAIVGGAKVSSKLQVLQALAAKVDQLIVGGGIANTLLAAAGYPVGRSLVDGEMLDFSRQLLDGKFGEATIPLPRDVVVAKEFKAGVPTQIRKVDAVAEDEMILDVGPTTAAGYAHGLRAAGTIVWNGPVGVFEIDEFAAGTRALAQAIAGSPAFSIAGGGDTLAAIDVFDVRDGISYISTGGGAFLDFLAGETLPGVAALEARARD